MEEKSLKELCQLPDIRGMIDDGFRIRRDYNSVSKIKRPKIARFKCRFDFKDGNRFYMYSFDFHKDPQGIFCDEWLAGSQILYQWNEWKSEVKKLTVWANMLDLVPLTSKKRYDILFIERSPGFEWNNEWIHFPVVENRHKVIRWKPGGKEKYFAWEQKRKQKLTERHSIGQELMAESFT